MGARVAPDSSSAIAAGGDEHGEVPGGREAVRQQRRTGPKSLDDALSQMAALGHENDWEARNAAIQALPALLGALQDDANGFRHAVEAIGAPLSEQLGDLRSALVRTACDVLRELAVQFGRGVAPLVAAVLPQLLSNLSLLKVFKDVSATAATVALGLAPSGAALKVLVEHSQDPKKQVRQGSFELLGLILGDESFVVPPVAKGISLALSALGTSSTPGRGVTDKDDATRTAAARAYWAAKLRYASLPEQLKLIDGWWDKLDAKEKKLVERQQPKVP